MAKEIERKYLVIGNDFTRLANPVFYRQGYISLEPKGIVRVRTCGEKAYITIKGKSTGISRDEYEYEIPYADASEMLDALCLYPPIEKHRYKVPLNGLVWEIDVFSGANQGLIFCEVELPAEDAVFEKPAWVGAEVTTDHRYYNAWIAQHPYNTW